MDSKCYCDQKWQDKQQAVEQRELISWDIRVAFLQYYS